MTPAKLELLTRYRLLAEEMRRAVEIQGADDEASVVLREAAERLEGVVARNDPDGLSVVG